MNYSGITLKKLEVFLVYLETLSMAKAAERLNMTGVGVHRALHSLEDCLRCKLFLSEGRNLKPMQSAFVFKDYATQILEHLEIAANHCREVADGERMTLRIGTLYSLTPQFMPSVISKLAVQHPNIRIEMTTNSNKRLLERLKANLVDVIIISTPADFCTQTFYSEFLFEDEAFIVTSPEVGLDEKTPIDLQSLKSEQFVTLADGFATFKGLQQATARAGFTPKLALQVHDIFTMGGLVRAGVGYSLMPGRTRTMFPDLHFTPLQEKYRVEQQISLITHKKNAGLQEFVSLIKTAVECAQPYYIKQTHSTSFEPSLPPPIPTRIQAKRLYKINVYSISQSLEGRGYSAELQYTNPDQSLEIIRLEKKQKKLKLEVHEKIDSTSQELIRRHAAGRIISGNIVTAREQSNSYGRFSRKWIGLNGGSLMFSVGWTFSRDLAEMSSLSLACGVAIVNALERQGLQGAELKWPNDIVYNYQKLGGILINVVASEETLTTVVVGVGINLSLPLVQLASIGQPATDLKHIAKDLRLNQDIDANAIYGAILDELTTTFYLYDAHGFQDMQQRWEALHAYQGKLIRLVQDDQIVEGKVVGITPEGAIRIHNGHDENSYIIGDVSLQAQPQPHT